MKTKNKSINISAPGKLVLCGEHAVLNGEPAISLAINQRIFVKITQIAGDDVFIKSKFGNLVLNYNNDSKISNQHIPKWGLQISFLLSNIKHWGLKIEIKSKIQEYGFGSSGALFSCVCCGLLLLNNDNLSKQDLLRKTLEFYFKYHQNTDFKPSGLDVATSILGGTIYYFPSQNIATKIQNNWSQNFKLFAIYTGHKTQTIDAKRIVDKVIQKDDIFKEIRDIVINIHSLLQQDKFDKQNFFSLLNDNQHLLEKLNLDDLETKDIIQQCRQQNVCAKISGSGLGDCIIAICEINKNFTIKNYKKVEVNIDTNGIKYEFK